MDDVTYHDLVQRKLLFGRTLSGDSTGGGNHGQKLFRRIVKQSFNLRRKMLRNSLRQVYAPDSPLPADCPYLDKRPEQLSVEDFIQLTNLLEGAHTRE